MKLLIVDDHALFREGMKLLLARLHADAVLIEAGSVEAALSHAGAHEEFDLILLDLNLPGMRGRDGVRLMRQRFPTSPIVVLTGVESEEAARECLNSGAQAFITKSVSGAVMLDKLRGVLDGQVFLRDAPALSRGDGGMPMRQLRSPWRLTVRQIEVLALVSRGLSNKEIARSLELSENTVRSHLAAIFREMGARSRTEAASLAHRHGIIQAEFDAVRR